MKKLRAFVQGETVGGRVFESLIQVLIIASLISFSLETLPNLDPIEKKALLTLELISVIIFSIEYILRIITSKKPFRFIFSFMGLVDLIAILPFYLTLGTDLRMVRALRLMRIFRVFKLVRYNKAFKRFQLALKIVREEIVIFFSAAILLIYLTSIGIYYFEHTAQPDKYGSVLDSVWWAVVTLTTVGYGDVYPITAGGRAFTIIILFIGLGVVAIPTGLLASGLTTAREVEKEEDEKSELAQKEMYHDTFEDDPKK